MVSPMIIEVSLSGLQVRLGGSITVSNAISEEEHPLLSVAIAVMFMVESGLASVAREEGGSKISGGNHSTVKKIKSP